MLQNNWIKIVFVILINVTQLHAQRNVSDSAISMPLLAAQYGINATAGDLHDIHGMFNHVGFFAGYKTKTNWIFGIDGNFMFGNRVQISNEELFSNLIDSHGNITDINGDVAIVPTYSRGYNVNATVGKIIPVLSPNPNSGIYLNAGAGYLVHHIRIETQNQVVPQIELNYKRGYDRLRSGLNTHQFIGYYFMSNKSFVNFYGGFYIQEGFTYNRRPVFYNDPDTPVPQNMMLDIQYGVKFAWMIPIYKRKPKDFYFN